MSPTSVFKEEAENASPESDFASMRIKNMQELAAAVITSNKIIIKFANNFFYNFIKMFLESGVGY